MCGVEIMKTTDHKKLKQFIALADMLIERTYNELLAESALNVRY